MESASQWFLTMRRGPCFILHWTGGYGSPLYSQLEFKGQTLDDFLRYVWKKFRSLQKGLNRLFTKLDFDAPNNPTNKRVFAKFMDSAIWAMSAAIDIRPYLDHYTHDPTNFLYIDFVFRLEEIYTKCLSLVYIFGDKTQKQQAYINLLHDFVQMGGISADGGPGHGLDCSITAYYRAFFSSTMRHAMAYQRFGALIADLAKLVQEKYPKAANKLAGSVDHLLKSATCGFSSTEFSSPAKSAMIEVLQQVVTDLQSSTAEKAA